jgi:hypothetical protein
MDDPTNGVVEQFRWGKGAMTAFMTEDLHDVRSLFFQLCYHSTYPKPSKSQALHVAIEYPSRISGRGVLDLRDVKPSSGSEGTDDKDVAEQKEQRFDVGGFEAVRRNSPFEIIDGNHLLHSFDLARSNDLSRMADIIECHSGYDLKTEKMRTEKNGQESDVRVMSRFLRFSCLPFILDL